MPEVSICIPTFNCAHFLPDAIGSVLRQGLSDFEIVVVDNASEDDTEAVVRGFDDSRIRYIRNPFNVGAAENGNRCVAEARGEYIKVLCADDVLLDGILPKQLAIMQSQPSVRLVTCDLFETDSELRIQRIVRYYPGSCSGERIVRACLSGLQNYMGGPSNFMFRRSDARGIRSDTSYRWVADLKFAIQLLGKGGLYVNIDEPGYLYRRHGSSDSAVNCPPHIRAAEFLRLVHEFDGWNLLSCSQAIRLGGVPALRVVARNLLPALTLTRSWKAIVSTADVLHMRRNARLCMRMPVPSWGKVP